jgi:hypothetical protein
MIWLTWRQHRTQVLVTVGLLLGLGVFLLVHGLGTADIAARLASDPQALADALGERFRPVNNVLGWLPLAPAAIGLFWGAPVLAKEFERGTHKLVWTQSVSRRRWIAIKLGGLSALVVLAGLAFGTMMQAWVSTFHGTRYAHRFGDVGMFVVTGIVPAAWWLFAFITGVAAGAVLRRTLPAIAVTLAVTVTAILCFFFFNVRTHYAALERVVLDGPGLNKLADTDAMIENVAFIGPDGRERPPFVEAFNCPPQERPCVAGADIRQVVYYHPASRYWRFQWTEAALLLAASVALGAVAVFWAARRRI